MTLAIFLKYAVSQSKARDFDPSLQVMRGKCAKEPKRITRARVIKEEQCTNKKQRSRKGQAKLSDLPLLPLEMILNHLNETKNYASLSSFKSASRFTKLTVESFMQQKSKIPEVIRINILKMEETIRTSFEIEIQIQKNCIPLFHNFGVLKDRVSVTFKIPVRSRRDPVVSYLTEAMSERIGRLDIENVRSMDELRFIRKIIGNAKIDKLRCGADSVMQACGAEFCSELLIFIKESSVNFLSFGSWGHIIPGDPDAFADALVDSCSDAILTGMHRKVRFNQFLGLTNAQWMEKLAPFCAFFNEMSVDVVESALASSSLMDRPLSPIEKLPGNLFDAIIDYASKAMRDLVDSYVFSAPNLVHRMEIKGAEEGEARSGTFHIAMEVQPEMANRFELQLRLVAVGGRRRLERKDQSFCLIYFSSPFLASFMYLSVDYGGNHPRSREEALGDEQRTHHCSVGLFRFGLPLPPPPLLQFTEGRGYWRPMAPVCPRHMDRRLLMAIRLTPSFQAKKCLPTDIRYKKTRNWPVVGPARIVMEQGTIIRYKQTSEGAAATAETVKSKFNDMRNSSLFKSFESKLGIAYTSAKMTASTSIDAGDSMSGSCVFHMCARYVYPRELIRRDPPNGVSSMLVYRATATVADWPTAPTWQELVSSLTRTAHTIRTVHVENCSADPNRTMVWMFLTGVNMRKLEYTSNRLNEEEVANIHSLIRVHEVAMLSLCVKEVAPNSCSASPPVGLSKHSTSINYFDWAPTILAIFDGENELDKLCIENTAYPDFLTQESITSLCENLPNVGKEVWFESTLHLPSTDASFSSKTCGHYVKDKLQFMIYYKSFEHMSSSIWSDAIFRFNESATLETVA
ncbi:hypothetical protein PRIPAC_78941, partial [Pristionchus pacificus]|uniref:Uncharacterized protein n=1 Tax=Pristionchus pacificus TaxID=54126 RepID=A0A2A6BWJ4_PRIPA